jgi:hypothetical protein
LLGRRLLGRGDGSLRNVHLRGRGAEIATGGAPLKKGGPFGLQGSIPPAPARAAVKTVTVDFVLGRRSSFPSIDVIDGVSMYLAITGLD